MRKNRSEQNRMRARIALQVVADEYKKVKLAFVNGSISKEAMQKAHVSATSQVASIRQQWKAREAQIDAFYENAVARSMTMDNFVQ